MARFIGTETEYGIATPQAPTLSPIITSTHLVVVYGAQEPNSISSHWNYASEHPLRDSRGFDLKRYHVVPTISPTAIGVANVVLSNGGRFYVDHAHPEYSSPETSNAYEAMVYDQAGDLVVRQAIADVKRLTDSGHSVLDGHEPCPPLKIYKNNVDGKGASYGAHENYFYRRSIDFDVLAQSLIPFFAVRPIITGAGRVGIGQQGETPGFQISQRADYIEQEISLETTLNRALINTRDEPHASSADYGRLHVIIGDANMSQTSTFLKLGMTSLVIDAVEQGIDFSDLALKNAVETTHEVSHDLTLSKEIPLANGEKTTAIALMRAYLNRVIPTTDIDHQVVTLWEKTLALLEQGPEHAAHLLDWCAKLALINSYLNKGIAINDPKLSLIDLQYSDIDPAKSLYHALVRAGRMHTLASEEEIAHAALHAPVDTRAYLRGYLATYFPRDVISASWETITIATGTDTEAIINMPTLDTCTGITVENALTDQPSITAVVDTLTELFPENISVS